MRSAFITTLIQCVMISVGLGLIVDYNHSIWLRYLGLTLLVVALDWRYLWKGELK